MDVKTVMGCVAFAMSMATTQAQIQHALPVRVELGTMTLLTQASSSRGTNPIELAFAHRAAVTLGNVDVESWTTRLRQALRDARTRAESIGAGAPGALSLGQALLMQELGEVTDARPLLKEALRAPDRLLSHHLARQAREAEDPGPK